MPNTVVFRGLTQEQANATARVHLSSGATSANIIPDGALFSVQVTYPDSPATATNGKVDPAPAPPTDAEPTKPVPGGLPFDQITQLAGASALAGFAWKDRGKAPAGYIKGMALVYGRVYCKFKAGDAAALDMAQKNTGNSERDALAWYDDVFSAAGMNNSTSGVDTLRHLFVLLIGLGMRESSGKHCEGRDTTANNVTADTAEAGLFQVSFDAKGASPLLPQIFAQYRANPSGFLDVFKQGVSCSAASLENFGDGDGRDFQRLCKECPAFAGEFAAVALRHLRKHWGPINRKEAQVRPECDALLSQVQAAIDASPLLGSALA